MPAAEPGLLPAASTESGRLLAEKPDRLPTACCLPYSETLNQAGGAANAAGPFFLSPDSGAVCKGAKRQLPRKGFHVGPCTAALSTASS